MIRVDKDSIPAAIDSCRWMLEQSGWKAPHDLSSSSLLAFVSAVIDESEATDA